MADAEKIIVAQFQKGRNGIVLALRGALAS
ncbi:hypothetical protein J2854_003152 [Agrobacterium tumefaciens]|nr:hypothetical protein [Agrobacterium tumefaciens]